MPSVRPSPRAAWAYMGRSRLSRFKDSRWPCRCVGVNIKYISQSWPILFRSFFFSGYEFHAGCWPLSIKNLWRSGLRAPNSVMSAATDGVADTWWRHLGTSLPQEALPDDSHRSLSICNGWGPESSRTEVFTAMDGLPCNELHRYKKDNKHVWISILMYYVLYCAIHISTLQLLGGQVNFVYRELWDSLAEAKSCLPRYQTAPTWSTLLSCLGSGEEAHHRRCCLVMFSRDTGSRFRWPMFPEILIMIENYD